MVEIATIGPGRGDLSGDTQPCRCTARPRAVSPPRAREVATPSRLPVAPPRTSHGGPGRSAVDRVHNGLDRARAAADRSHLVETRVLVRNSETLRRTTGESALDPLAAEQRPRR